MKKPTIDELANFCKRKGFVYPSGEIYGGSAGFWDFGPLGVELKKNIKDAWWNFHVRKRSDVAGLDGSIITHPKVWEASGHVGNFIDVAVYNKKTKEKKKVDKHELKNLGPEWENKGEFNPMFTTNVGPIKEDSKTAYLRPETAQLIFANFKLVQDNARLKLPFGIAQIGKSFRNEIAPRNFIFRVRELEQMELEYFINPNKKTKFPKELNYENLEIQVYSSDMQERESEPKKMKIKEALQKKIIQLEWHAYWLSTELNWFKNLGANLENFRIRQHTKDEKSHYATDTWDLEYHFPFGWKELQGIADRGTYDLEQHEKHSKKDLKILDGDKKVLPMVVAEPALGVERAFLVFLFEAYRQNEKGNVALQLHPKLSPVKVAIFPLIKKDDTQVKIAKEIFEELSEEMNVNYDESGSIGRRYARNDEIGTPFCITIDDDSKKNKTVTIRNRNDGKQKKIAIKDTEKIILDLISEKISFQDLG